MNNLMPALEHYRILLIEDHPLVATSLRRVLESRGHKVKLMATLSNSAIIEEAITWGPEVVVADLHVGLDNGWTWAGKVFGSGKDLLPAIIVLMSAEPPAFPSTEFYLKGTDPVNLIKMVEKTASEKGACERIDRKAREWITDSGKVLAFARVLHDAGYFSEDVDPCEAMLSYFEKPWKWTAEREKYEAWRAETPVHGDTIPLPDGFFDEGDDT